MRLLALVAGVLVLFALRASRPVTMPLALGLTLAMLAWPIQRFVARRAPRWLGVLAAVLAIVLAIAVVFSALGWSADLLADRARENRGRIEELRGQAATFGRRFGIEVPGGGSGGTTASGPASDATGAGAGGEAGGAQSGNSLGRALFDNLGFLALAIGFAALALAELDALRARVRARFDEATAERVLSVGAEVAGAVRRYFAVKTLTSLITGTATALYTLAVGLDLVLIWGMTSFLLEYVPSVGSILAVVPPTLYAFLQFDGFVRPLAIGAGLALLQLILGNFVDPRLEGRHMSISPMIVLLSIVFWAWVWGPIGALLGVPVTVTLLIVARHFPGTRWMSDLLTDEGRQKQSG
jgi:AI-2 transport protein TqsA